MIFWLVLALLINNIVIFFMFSYIIELKVLRIVEGLIEETNELMDKGDYDTARTITSISTALNNSIGSKHDRSRSSH